MLKKVIAPKFQNMCNLVSSNVEKARQKAQAASIRQGWKQLSREGRGESRWRNDARVSFLILASKQNRKLKPHGSQDDKMGAT